MNEEDVNEALHKMVKDGKLLLLKDKNMQFYPFVESAPVINLEEEEEIERRRRYRKTFGNCPFLSHKSRILPSPLEPPKNLM